jgi:hypothetical protein
LPFEAFWFGLIVNVQVLPSLETATADAASR